MGIYIFIIIFISICAFSKKNIYTYVIVYFLLLLIGGCRGLEVGTDTLTYLAIYNTVGSLQFNSFYLIEPGWVIINLIGYNLFGDFRSVLIMAQMLILTPLFIRLWNATQHPFLGVLFFILLYYYLNSFNITRQIIAAIIVLYGLPYLVDHKYKKFILAIGIACLFHLSSIFCISMIFINRMPRLSNSTICILLVSTYILGIYVIQSAMSYIPFLGKYMVYIDRGGEASNSLSRILLNGFFMIIYLFLRRSKYIQLLFCGIIAYNLFCFSPSIGRIAIYFMITQLYIVSNIRGSFRSNYQLYSLFLIYGLFNFFVLLNANVSEVVPYRFL